MLTNAEEPEISSVAGRDAGGGDAGGGVTLENNLA